MPVPDKRPVRPADHLVSFNLPVIHAKPASVPPTFRNRVVFEFLDLPFNLCPVFIARESFGFE